MLKSIGVIAQEIEKILPELVRESNDKGMIVCSLWKYIWIIN